MKYLLTLIIILLTVYAPAELTRVLLCNTDFITRRPEGYILELCFMWGGWVFAMFMAYVWIEFGLWRRKWNGQ